MYVRANLHDALTLAETAGHSVAPSQLLKWSARTFVKRDECILMEGDDDDGLYLLYRGLVQVSAPPLRAPCA